MRPSAEKGRVWGKSASGQRNKTDKSSVRKNAGKSHGETMTLTQVRTRVRIAGATNSKKIAPSRATNAVASFFIC